MVSPGADGSPERTLLPMCENLASPALPPLHLFVLVAAFIQILGARRGHRTLSLDNSKDMGTAGGPEQLLSGGRVPHRLPWSPGASFPAPAWVEASMRSLSG